MRMVCGGDEWFLEHHINLNQVLLISSCRG
jgi:hypothetical protein